MNRFILTAPNGRLVGGIEGLTSSNVSWLRRRGWRVLPA